ncbi:hypothetical protein ACFY2M_11575 [Streptomyces sp. NPDC001276]|uniref:hypothetical protein n=1 Tax=Streptomyces sp. NPDC001276 TaxID=3364555 RepID=UPI0036ACC124
MDSVHCEGYGEPTGETGHPESAPDEPAPPACRELLARPEREPAEAVRTASHATVDEGGPAAQGIASGLKIAAAHAVTVFEGHAARDAWPAGLSAGTGPTVFERNAPPTTARTRAARRRGE